MCKKYNLLRIVFGVWLLVSVTNLSYAATTVKGNDMGLSKGSVFVVPTPKVYHYGTTQPGESKLLPRAFPGAPPQIPHAIGDFLPITAQNNLCISCHDQPGEWGKKVAPGSATPMPSSHYTDQRNAPGKVMDHLSNARFNCNQCHVPQTDAPALVKNTFSATGKKR